MNTPTTASVAEATDIAIAAATHLTEMDAGAVAALRTLARRIDTEHELRELALAWAEANDARPPSTDNVAIPTYLKYCESLGLTPLGRARSADGKKGGPGSASRLAAARETVPRPR